MTLKQFFDEALVKGENIKDEIISEVLKSKFLNEMLRSDRFERAVSRVIKTKDEVANTIKRNVKGVFQVMNVPTQDDLRSLERKINQIERTIDKVGKKVITVRSLKKIRRKKAAKRKTKRRR